MTHDGTSHALVAYTGLMQWRHKAGSRGEEAVAHPPPGAAGDGSTIQAHHKHFTTITTTEVSLMKFTE